MPQLYLFYYYHAANFYHLEFFFQGTSGQKSLCFARKEPRLTHTNNIAAVNT